MSETATDEIDELAEGVDGETAEAEPEVPREKCLCGCGQAPTRKKSRFMPGHDATLKSRLYKTVRAGRDNAEANDEVKDEADKAAAEIEKFGWPQPAAARPKAERKPKAEGDDSDGESLDDLDPDGDDAEDDIDDEDL